MEEVLFFLSEFDLCTQVPQTWWKYHFIFHVWGEVFEETACAVTAMSAGNIRILFCNVFSYFSHFLYLFSGNYTCVSAVGENILIVEWIWYWCTLCEGEQKTCHLEELSRQYHPSEHWEFVQTMSKFWNIIYISCFYGLTPFNLHLQNLVYWQFALNKAESLLK